jgi:AraC-like DNA-binding protein
MIGYMWTQNQAQSLRLEMAGEVAILRSSLAGPRPDSSRQSNELTVAVMLRTLQRLLGHSWRPEAIAFTHAAPPDLTAHRRVLGMAPMFVQPLNGLVIAAADLEAPVIDADPVAARRVERYIEQVEGRRKADPLAVARELVVVLLPTGGCSATRVARHMGVDRRTLHRWLGEGGYSFVTLLEEVRKNLAAAHLAARDRSLTEIADCLGYASLSAFSRWHQRRFGMRPSATRARIGADGLR